MTEKEFKQIYIALLKVQQIRYIYEFSDYPFVSYDSA